MNRSSLAPLRSALSTAALLGLLLSAAAPARALTVLDTYGPGNSTPGLDWVVSGASATAFSQSLALPFTLPTAATIDSVLAALSGTGSFSLGISAGVGLPGGPLLYSATLSNPVAQVSLTGLDWSLPAGSYWLVSHATSAGAAGSWLGGGSTGGDQTAAWAATGFDGSWMSAGIDDAPAARIMTTQVPEPGSWALMLGGLLALGRLQRYRRRG